MDARSTPLRIAAVLALATLPQLVLTQTPLVAQASNLVIDAGVSHTLPPGEALIDESSSYALLGARFDVPLSRASLLFGSGYVGLTPDAEVGNWASGSVGTVLIVPLGARVDIGATVWGGGFTVGGLLPYNGITGRVAPEVRLYLSGWTVALRGAGGLGRTNTTFSRDTRAVTVSDNLWSYGGGAEIGRIAGLASAFLGAEVFESSRGSYLSGYARAALRTGSVSTRLELGLWDTPLGFEPTGLVSVSVPVGRGVRAELSGGRSAPDPLLGTPSSGDFGAILSWQAIGAASASELVDVSGGDAVFTLDAPVAAKVFIVGDMTLWIPVPMERANDGAWSVELSVEPGRYEFGFLVDGAWYVPPAAKGIVIDEWGQPNATLVVPDVH
jgi:hypothetical protein